MRGKLKMIGKYFGLLVTGVLLAATIGVPVASAEEGRAWWHLTLGSHPTYLPPQGEGTLMVLASNVGDGSVKGENVPVTLTDKLPAGLTATSVQGTAGLHGRLFGVAMECAGTSVVVCTFTGTLPNYEVIEIKIHVKVDAGASSGELNSVGVVGGGAPSASLSRPITISASSTPFGVETYELTPENADGSPATQAGSHPFQLTTSLYLNGGPETTENGRETVAQPALPKDLNFALPPGLLGNPSPFPRCSDTQFAAIPSIGANDCPTNTQVGVAIVTIFEPTALGYFTIPEPVFELVPSVGEPARFGFSALGVPVILDTSLRTGGDYGVSVNVKNLTELAGFHSSQVTFWGVPGDPRHDSSRGNDCVGLSRLFGTGGGCQSPEDTVAAPLLSLPTSCGNPASEPLSSSVTVDSWSDPSALTAPMIYRWHDSLGAPLALDGCNRLAFEPSISATPDGQAASTPTGLTVGVHVPQESILSPTGLAESNLKSTRVTLPQGVQLSPAAADGLLACSLGQIGLETAAVPACPEASKIATVELTTPLLEHPLDGEVYLAAQDANPFGSLVAMYIVVEDPTDGILIKIAGEVGLNEQTGQAVAVFENTPELPFEDLRLHFFGSARAPLTTPPLCGSYITRASFAPWSGNAPAEPSSTFQITSGPNGTPCGNPRPFAPGFQAGSTNLQAGGFTPFTLTMSRPDADQTLAGLSVQLPPGLSGNLSKVQLCGEPQASTGDCPAGSLIGHTVVSAGLGNDPFTVEGGQVFITGPYKGAPFGLSILNPAQAGPFNLGYVVVRAKVEVDPTTAALHIVSDPLPTIKDGIALQIQHVNVTVDRPEFTFNPTDCNPLKLTGTMTSSEGASASVETPFQVTNCASLAFRPGLEVSTSGKTSKAKGASLDVKLIYPSGPAGTLANIAKVKVELPKQLPSQLKTLQKACTEAVFDADPESCPAASRVGEATATTPILAGGLAGPAYFVSHGGAKFPELVVVLKGEDGVTVDLHGETFISKKGITSSTFNTVPDVPVGSFELKLPQGPYAALAANGNLCKSKLAMPTEFVAQNGAVIHQSAKIKVSNCPKARKVSHKKKGKRAGAKSKHNERRSNERRKRG
ncbi:MAG TPA: hypothetical protein VGL57_08655 [Solirubrobacteraceae bacterium]